MYTTEHDHVRRPEGFLLRQRRQLLGARFHGAEQVVLGHEEGETLAEYLRSGPVSRGFSRGFALFVAVAGLGAAIAVFGVLLGGEVTGWPAAGTVGFGLAMGWFGARQLAGWRCMRRHRHAPRRTR
ncbi:MAG: hypothetical protein L0I76_00965 [Pseudonocardia sp.]|nr:hypothetical protein [Pseudonocardia sp.]